MNPTLRNILKIMLLGIPYLNRLPPPWNRIAITVASAAVAGIAAWYGLVEFANVDIADVLRNFFSTNQTTLIQE